MAVVVKKLKEKMTKLFPELTTQIAIVDSLADIKYIDSELEKQRLAYIKDYVSANFDLIEVNQYSLPLSGILLGFFKISERVMLVLYSKTGKIGNLLAYRGIIESFTSKIDEALDLMQEIYDIESLAYDIIRLKKVKTIKTSTATPAITIDSADRVSTMPTQISSPDQIYPKLIPKYAKKKFSFKESLVLQHADGKNSVEEISEKCNFQRQEVLEIIDKYQKKGWVELIYKE